MDLQRWTTILSRISRHEADDIDAVIAPFDRRCEPAGRDVFPPIAADLLPQAALKRTDAVCVGLRVPAEPADAPDRAMRLAAFAIERDVEIVVLAHGDISGLERFGFRTERIAGDTEADRARCEDQIRRFWGIELVL